MAQQPLVRHLSSTTSKVAGDGCFLRELLHPARDSSPIGYSLAHAYVEAGGRTNEHTLAQTEVYYILAGSGTLVVDGIHHPVQAGTCICVPPLCHQHLLNTCEQRLEFLCIVEPPWTAAGETIISPE